MNELKQKIIDICNESKLPLEAITFVVRDVYRDVLETWEAYQKSQEQNNKKQEDFNHA